MIVDEIVIFCTSVLTIDDVFPFKVELYILAFKLMLKLPAVIEAIP